MYSGPDDVSAIVADIGSGMAKIGFGGEDFPRYYAPSYTAQAAAEDAMDTEDKGAAQRPRILCDPIPTHRLEHQDIKPIAVDGKIEDWDALERLWTYVLEGRLHTSLSAHPVMLAEKSYNDSASRQRYAELLFEKFDAPALFLSKDAVLSAYACARATALVCDISASGTTVTPVVDGWAERPSTMWSRMGGDLMDRFFLEKVLRKPPVHASVKPAWSVKKEVNAANGLVSCTPVDAATLAGVRPSAVRFAELSASREAKEAICRCADVTLAPGDPRFSSVPTTPHELPDGTTVEVGLGRFQVSELLFDPALAFHMDAAEEARGEALRAHSGLFCEENVPQMLMQSAVRCGHEHSSALLESVVLCGGAACFDGLSDRLLSETNSALMDSAPGWKVRVHSPENRERKVAAWLGGSIVACLGTFHEMWIGKKEYEEHGAAIVDRKCP